MIIRVAMKPLLSLLAILVCVSSFALTAHSLTEEEARDGFVSLFDGTDMDAWYTAGSRNTFSVKDGLLESTGEGGVVLRTKEIYEDYILRLEYKISPGGNSGVFLHAVDNARDSRAGGEIQVLDSFGRDPSPHTAGALYDVFAPSVNAARHPSEWQEMEIHFEWPMLKVTHNGQQVLHVEDLREEPKTRYRTRFGNIGLQDHGSPVQYRNIRIKDLGGDDQDQWIPMLADPEMNDWFAIGSTEWEYDDGVVTAKNSQGALLHTLRMKDFELWGYVRAVGRAEGAVYFRWSGNSDKDRGQGVLVHSAKGATQYTGSLIDAVPVTRMMVNKKSWALLQVIAKGGKTEVRVNGTIMAQYDQTVDKTGIIAFTRESCCGQLMFRDFRVKPLDPMVP